MTTTSFIELDQFLSDHRLELVPSKDRRQYVVSKQPIRAGAIVYALPSLYGFPQIDHGAPTRCFCCYKVLSASDFRCSQCRCVSYCSPSCQQVHWKLWHRAECKHLKSVGVFPKIATGKTKSPSLLSIQRSDEMRQFDPEKAMLIGVLQQLRYISQNTASNKPKALPQWLTLQAKALEHLVDHRSDLPSDLIQRFELLAADVLKNSEAGQIFSRSNAAPLTSSDLVKYLCKFHCNNFISHDASMFSIGEVAHPVSSLLFNHSCIPNCIHIYTKDGFQLIRALHDIPARHELTIAYVDPITPRTERRRRLKDVYAFDCTCPRCVGPTHGGVAGSDGNDDDLKDYWNSLVHFDRLFDKKFSQKDAAGQQPQSYQGVDFSWPKLPRSLVQLTSHPEYITKLSKRVKAAETLHPVPTFNIFKKIQDQATSLESKGISSLSDDQITQLLELSKKTLYVYGLVYPQNYPIIAFQYIKIAAHSISAGEVNSAREYYSLALKMLKNALGYTVPTSDIQINNERPNLVGIEDIDTDIETIKMHLESSQNMGVSL
ncbi:hypothetical protein H4219_003725 [Mycoemilia scoparia]|uniref:SET domain-containing protein n=1 Tax=Mycoemilia scoparia TaxID=417184 RepID=A0A9W8A0H5_9FUNG|nr:hypothetical protein H4219_003725 [Mycoemilia scoparia]